MKINARNLVADIHSSVTVDEIRKHYQISEGQFRKAFDQLVSAKLLRPEELPRQEPDQPKPFKIPATPYISRDLDENLRCSRTMAGSARVVAPGVRRHVTQRGISGR
ncbi:MAG: hypothetical protein RDU20_07785 [Desulfomonilaceae bacterium]|nr:hypothetical protein [Desulfomonilaceae bacterium]